MPNFGQFCITSDFHREYLRKEATYPKSERHTYIHTYIHTWYIYNQICNAHRKSVNRQNRRPRAIHPAFDEKSPVNFGALTSNYKELHMSLDPLKCTFLDSLLRYISALRGAAPGIFLHALEIDQGYLAHIPTGTWVPPQKFNRENKKWLKIQRVSLNKFRTRQTSRTKKFESFINFALNKYQLPK